MARSREEFAGFVDVQLRPLLGLGYALTGNEHDAWDLVQEALARLGTRWGRRDILDPAAYVRTIMVRLNIDRLRHLRRELLLPVTPERPGPPVTVDGIEPWLAKALASLSPAQRTALALRFVEDLDTEQIADRMGCSTGTARSHLSRGIGRLRDHVPSQPHHSASREGEHP
jgi:RNA polymerase sigma factor (sigma-70 family)